MRSRLATLVSRGLAARLASADEGVTSIEYALIGALIAIVIIGAVTTIGTDLQSVFNTVASDL
ncbi:Flp family type IVb pilin [Paraburkholderia kururiensis]|uniref:Flp family type IVb pilin n=1 Tax=Paraburkholderia TaxID=1822464 RepID=UPI0009DB1E00